MADLFTSLVSIVPKPSTAGTAAPGNGNTTFTGTFGTNTGSQVQVPGGKK